MALDFAIDDFILKCNYHWRFYWGDKFLGAYTGGIRSFGAIADYLGAITKPLSNHDL